MNLLTNFLDFFMEVDFRFKTWDVLKMNTKYKLSFGIITELLFGYTIAVSQFLYDRLGLLINIHMIMFVFPDYQQLSIKIMPYL